MVTEVIDKIPKFEFCELLKQGGHLMFDVFYILKHSNLTDVNKLKEIKKLSNQFSIDFYKSRYHIDSKEFINDTFFNVHFICPVDAEL